MELRVWVDGVQRIVCGVRLTTTCQEIVFVLAKATHQAGRFTMIERWRNNERLLSPNEQPLVTLQRWGEHMNEVEFILKKANSNSALGMGPMNGYQTRSETTNTTQHYFNNLQADQQQQQQQVHQQQKQQQLQQQQPQQPTKNHPFEELYSTINKNRVHNPPAVPAKPRLVVPMTSMANHHPPYPPPLQQPINNNAQANFYGGSRTGSPSTIFQNNLRPRQPPGYSDYLEALASRNSSGHSVIPSSAHYITRAQSSPHLGNNLTTMFNSQQANSSGVSQTSYTDNQFQDHHLSGPSAGNYCSPSQDDQPDRVSRNSIRSRLGEPGLVINLGSAVNVKLPPSNLSGNPTSSQDNLQRSVLQKSVSEIGHDMLKMIEEQKKLLLNQKDELDRLDNDRDYWEIKQNSEQVEMVNRIENEIHQLEELWRENQAQISKLEYQDLEKEVKDLKAEQIRIESEIKQQKNKLIRCEDKITTCKSQIDRLESELATLNDTSTSDSSIANGTTSSGDNNYIKDNRSSDGEDDLDDDSEGDYSDDLNLATTELKLRAAKDLGYVDKRGLISGIRSLKLDKSRATKQLNEHIRHTNNSITDVPSPDSPDTKDKTNASSNNNNVNNGCSETNGQYSAKTATSNNQYEFLMTL